MLKWLLSDKQIEKHYSQAGAIFGTAVSYIYMGECVGFKRMLRKWEKWEAEYARRGYRTMPLDDFIEYGGHGIPLNSLGKKRSNGEDPVYHAKIYREIYLGKIKPVINLGDPHIQCGTYLLPSTKRHCIHEGNDE